MIGSVRDRIGLSVTGLDPRHPREWVERVRRNALEPHESAGTLILVYRLWLVALTLKALGSGWDVAWHFRWFRDDFAPPHLINLAGDGLVILLVLFHWYTRFGVDRWALRLMETGVIVFLASAPVDVINHRLNGLDITSWSLTHFGLYTGTAIMIAGAIRGWSLHGGQLPGRSLVLGGLWFFFLENVLFPNQHQEYGVLAIRAFLAGRPTADAELLAFAADKIGVPALDSVTVRLYALPIPDWVYPVWIVGAAMPVLLLARRSIGLRWSATTIAAAYVAWRCVLWPLFVGMGFPQSTVPFLLLGGAVAIDVVCLIALPWLAEAAAGAVLVTGAVYVGGFAQSTVLAAPPIAYWSAPSAAAALFVAWAALGALSSRVRPAEPTFSRKLPSSTPE
jgi:hypothetical protein